MPFYSLQRPVKAFWLEWGEQEEKPTLQDLCAKNVINALSSPGTSSTIKIVGRSMFSMSLTAKTRRCKVFDRMDWIYMISFFLLFILSILSILSKIPG